MERKEGERMGEREGGGGGRKDGKESGRGRIRKQVDDTIAWQMYHCMECNIHVACVHVLCTY